MPKSNVTEVLKKKIAKGMMIVGLIIQGEAKRYCPKVTGQLANSIHIDYANETGVSVSAGKKYAPNVEFAAPDPYNPKTSWKALQKRGGKNQRIPFLRSAIYLNKSKIENVIKKSIEL